MSWLGPVHSRMTISATPILTLNIAEQDPELFSLEDTRKGEINSAAVINRGTSSHSKMRIRVPKKIVYHDFRGW